MSGPYKLENFMRDEASGDILTSKNQRVLTPCIITLLEAQLTEVDIENFIEAGLRTVRFRIQITQEEKVKLMSMLKNACAWCCEKYSISTWPIALSIDIPNACIKTGTTFSETAIHVKQGDIVKLTSDEQFSNSMKKDLIFIDDPYALKEIKIGTEVTIQFGNIVMICTEIIDSKTVKCRVITGGKMDNEDFVCIRGIKHLKPPLNDKDLEWIAFAIEFQADIITINSVRYPTTLNKIRAYFPKDRIPLIVSTICEQEGLDNIDAIIENSDGIILAREFMAHEIMNKHVMPAIQMQICGKCRKLGKPFYISGNILEKSLEQGYLAASDLNDVTNAVLQGAGFMLRAYKKQKNLVKAMSMLTSICKFVEPFSKHEEFWRLCVEYRMPVNIADAAIVASALLARQSGSLVVIVPTVTGRTAIKLAHIAPDAIILTISAKARVARQLLLYRGIFPIIYEKKTLSNWFEEDQARVQFAVAFALKHEFLNYGNKFVVLKKALSNSSFCDHVSVWTVRESSGDAACISFLNPTTPDQHLIPDLPMKHV